MEIKKIKELAKVLKEYDLSVIDITDGENKIRLEKSCEAENNSCCEKSAGNQIMPTVCNDIETPSEVDFNDIKEIKSPMVGVFYQAPSPESKPFVKIGDRIKKGDTLCIIEAMKLMNEITAELDGEIIDICAENGEIVEYSQTLFKIF